jgi:hypothetical protein
MHVNFAKKSLEEINHDAAPEIGVFIFREIPLSKLENPPGAPNKLQ